MGGAIVEGMLSSGNYQKNEIIAILPTDSPDIELVKSKYGIEVTDIANLPELDYLVIAIKPQILEEVLPTLKISPSTCVISIAAGKKVEYFRRYFPESPIIRTMPNINAMVMHSVTVGCYDGEISEDNKRECEKIFKSVGTFDFVDDENLMDAVTSISGSGPAYFFRFVELLNEAGVAAGLSEDVATTISLNTFVGSAKLAENSDKSIGDLRSAVTSKAGVTQAALDVFNADNRLGDLIKDVVQAAIKRSKELSS